MAVSSRPSELRLRVTLLEDRATLGEDGVGSGDNERDRDLVFDRDFEYALMCEYTLGGDLIFDLDRVRDLVRLCTLRDRLLLLYTRSSLECQSFLSRIESTRCLRSPLYPSLRLIGILLSRIRSPLLE